MNRRTRQSKRRIDDISSPSTVLSGPNVPLKSAVITPDIPVKSSHAKRAYLAHNSPVHPDHAPSSTSLCGIASKTTTGCLPPPVSKKQVRPSPEECAYVVLELGKLHPEVLEETLKEQKNQWGSSCGTKRDILDGVVSTMLSQNTTNANSTRAFENLKKAFPSWEMVVKLTSTAKLEEAIHCGGLAKIKAGRILSICQTLQKERGSPSLEYLRESSNKEIQRELLRFPGLGKKTVSCVLLFTLGRDEFPVDTHVYRIAKQLKWIPSQYTRDEAYDYLNSVIPSTLKRNLHCLLIQHGRECHHCAARGKPQFPPKDGTKLHCPLKNLSSLKDIQMVKVKPEKK